MQSHGLYLALITIGAQLGSNFSATLQTISRELLGRIPKLVSVLQRDFAFPPLDKVSAVLVFPSMGIP